MLKRIVWVLLPVVVLCAVSVSFSLAQNTPYPEPEAGVRGSGAIEVHGTNIGHLDINVGKSGNVIFGGFRYTEMSSTGQRVAVIYSQTLMAVDIQGKYAKVQALGYWNGMWSSIEVEVEDRYPRMDWMKIVARPEGPITITIIYTAEGDLIKGDFIVFGAPVVPDAVAKGDGRIAVGQNIGRFLFRAERRGEVVKGSINYEELGPITSPTTRPRIRIYVPEVKEFHTPNPRTAVLVGKGTLNGRPALIRVRAIDNVGTSIRDEFHIWAEPLSSASITKHDYYAGGPLMFGDIVVHVIATP